jgi:hypothetical protein
LGSVKRIGGELIVWPYMKTTTAAALTKAVSGKKKQPVGSEGNN